MYLPPPFSPSVRYPSPRRPCYLSAMIVDIVAFIVYVDQMLIYVRSTAFAQQANSSLPSHPASTPTAPKQTKHLLKQQPKRFAMPLIHLSNSRHSVPSSMARLPPPLVAHQVPPGRASQEVVLSLEVRLERRVVPLLRVDGLRVI